jgi:hypothetical protein
LTEEKVICKRFLLKVLTLSMIFGIFGFLLIYVGVSIPELFFLAWIGVWIVMACLIFEFYRWRKEMKND